MTGHEWHVLAAFGLLTVALAMFDGKLALEIVGVATAVIVVKNAGSITSLIP